MQWDRNTTGRLERLGASIEEGCEVILHTSQMETPLEEQQSQQGVHHEPNAYRSMRDHIHPPRPFMRSYAPKTELLGSEAPRPFLSNYALKTGLLGSGPLRPSLCF